MDRPPEADAQMQKIHREPDCCAKCAAKKKNSDLLYSLFMVQRFVTDTEAYSDNAKKRSTHNPPPKAVPVAAHTALRTAVRVGILCR